MEGPSDDHDNEIAAVESAPASGNGGAGATTAVTRAGPPLDDCCPICFSSFSVPCRSDCGHWYCGSCILRYWNYSSAPRKCKCPMCSHRINKLVPEPSLFPTHDAEVIRVLENVRRYNRLFVGGIPGLVQKMCGLPLFIKRILRNMMDPDVNLYVNEMRLFAMLLTILYLISPFDFIPISAAGVADLFDQCAILLVLFLHLVGLYRRRRLNQRVRDLAAIEQQQHEQNP